MKLAVWMAENSIEGTKLAKMLGVSRASIWKMKTNRPVDPRTAEKVYFITGGKVRVESWPVGVSKGCAVDCEQQPQ